jgi:cytosine/adenosine deaminase-related metal-dependent hydrolase
MSTKETVDTLLSGGTVITVDGQRRIYRDGAVALRGNIIVAVGKRADLDSRYEARETRDCRNKLIMPGFVNSHLHFYHTMPWGLAPEGLGGLAVVEFRAWEGCHDSHARGRDYRRAHRAAGAWKMADSLNSLTPR